MTTLRALPTLLLVAALLSTGCGGPGTPSAARPPQNAEVYRERLEAKLLAQHHAHPAYGRTVADVRLEAMGAPEWSRDGRACRMRWSQVVTDRFGQRIADLEEEYFVVTFGPGAPHVRRGAPAVSVGLAAEGTYSDYQPVRRLDRAADAGVQLHCPACGAPVDRSGLCAACRARASNAAAQASPPVLTPVARAATPSRQPAPHAATGGSDLAPVPAAPRDAAAPSRSSTTAPGRMDAPAENAAPEANRPATRELGGAPAVAPPAAPVAPPRNTVGLGSDADAAALARALEAEAQRNTAAARTAVTRTPSDPRPTPSAAPRTASAARATASTPAHTASAARATASTAARTASVARATPSAPAHTTSAARATPSARRATPVRNASAALHPAAEPDPADAERIARIASEEAERVRTGLERIQAQRARWARITARAEAVAAAPAPDAAASVLPPPAEPLPELDPENDPFAP